MRTRTVHTSTTARPALLMALVFSVFAFPAPVAAANRDPVDALRQALRTEDARFPTEGMLQFRRDNLQKKIDALKSIGELRRALALDDWKEYPGEGRNEAMRMIDAQMRQEVGNRLTAAIRQVIARGSPVSKLAIANLISEMGPDVNALTVGDTTGYARSLTPEVLKLIDDPDWAVRQEALRALSTIYPDPKVAVPVFRNIIEKDDNVDARRLAARGLGYLMIVVNQLRKRVGITHRVEADPRDVLVAAEAVLTAIKVAVRDPDDQVKRFALSALQQTMNGMADLINEPLRRKLFPPEGRPLSADEVNGMIDTYNMVRKEIDKIRPTMSQVNAVTLEIQPLLEGADAGVRLSAIEALESVSWVRLKIQLYVESVPLPSSVRDKIKLVDIADPLGAFFDKGLGIVAGLLSDGDARVRRMAVEFLENIEAKAVPAIPALTRALTDEDRYVRWGAARTLGNVAPLQSQEAIPNLARLLLDPDLNVRLAAATTLDKMGSLAAPAAPALAAALNDGNHEARMAIMGILLNIPRDKATVALPALVESLNDRNPSIRKQGAYTLGQLGPAAADTIPALRRLLGDEDAQVRISASDALLAITTSSLR